MLHWRLLSKLLSLKSLISKRVGNNYITLEKYTTPLRVPTLRPWSLCQGLWWLRRRRQHWWPLSSGVVKFVQLLVQVGSIELGLLFIRLTTKCTVTGLVTFCRLRYKGTKVLEPLESGLSGPRAACVGERRVASESGPVVVLESLYRDAWKRDNRISTVAKVGLLVVLVLLDR